MRARRRLGMERIELSDQDIARIDRLGEGDDARAWLEQLAPDQRAAVRAHVINERAPSPFISATTLMGPEMFNRTTGQPFNVNGRARIDGHLPA